MFYDNPNFYPTPEALAQKMKNKLHNKTPSRVLEPSAGKGDLIESMFPESNYRDRPDMFCIESDPDLQATLRGKNLKLLDTDFLSYSGWDKFDLIAMNPPFDAGDRHLLKAIEVLFCGEIVCLLNAETLKNPYTNTRKLLVRKLDELEADVEYVQGAFADAQRPTGVEVAIVHIRVASEQSDSLFEGMDKAREFKADEDGEIEDKHELSTGKTIEELVLSYQETVRRCIDAAIEFYKSQPKVGNYIDLVVKGGQSNRYGTNYSAANRSHALQNLINGILPQIRSDYWSQVLDLREVNSRLTSERRNEFEQAMSTQEQMDFTEDNIRQFVLNIIGSYEDTLRRAVVEIFNKMTREHCYHGGVNEKNIHYFNGWKTNDAFKVAKKVIIPVYGSCGGAFFDKMFNRWVLNWDAERSLDDIDIVMNYFDGMCGYRSLGRAIKEAFAMGESSGESTYFKFVCHKKGTIHLTFRDPDILRRFNVAACQGKGFLPQDYGSTEYSRLSIEEQSVVDAFEGKKDYNKNLGQPLFAENSYPRIAA